MIMTVWIADPLMALVGIVMVVKALAVKPAIDRMAIYDSNRR